jgi:hypothetical protein
MVAFRRRSHGVKRHRWMFRRDRRAAIDPLASVPPKNEAERLGAAIGRVVKHAIVIGAQSPQVRVVVELIVLGLLGALYSLVRGL